MTLWTAILFACAATYLIKLAGYAVPARWLQNPAWPAWPPPSPWPCCRH